MWKQKFWSWNKISSPFIDIQVSNSKEHLHNMYDAASFLSQGSSSWMHKLLCLCCHDLSPQNPIKGNLLSAVWQTTGSIYFTPQHSTRMLCCSSVQETQAELCDSLFPSHFCISPCEHVPRSCWLLLDARHSGSRRVGCHFIFLAFPQQMTSAMVFTQLAIEELHCTEVLDLFNKKTRSSLTRWLKLYLLCNATALTVQGNILWRDFSPTSSKHLVRKQVYFPVLTGTFWHQREKQAFPYKS